jgi:hypothetical protein
MKAWNISKFNNRGKKKQAFERMAERVSDDHSAGYLSSYDNAVDPSPLPKRRQQLRLCGVGKLKKIYLDPCLRDSMGGTGVSPVRTGGTPVLRAHHFTVE